MILGLWYTALGRWYKHPTRLTAVLLPAVLLGLGLAAYHVRNRETQQQPPSRLFSPGVMDRLPQELIELIASHLGLITREPTPGPEGEENSDEQPYATPTKAAIPWAPLAVTSRAWQHAVERRTFRSIKIDSDELGEFRKLLTPRRRAFLKDLTFTVILPSYGSAASKFVETRKDKQANDVAYSAAMRSLFKLLKTWESDEAAAPGHRFKLCINHPVSRSDVQWYDGRGIKGPRGELYEGRYYHSYTRLLGVESLPQLHQVSKLVMKMPEGQLGHRMVHPKVPIQVASKLPNLESIHVDVNDNEKRYIECRRSNRRELAQTLQQVSLPALKVANLHFFHASPKNHHFMPPSLDPVAEHDLLGSACYSFSQSLVDLSINGVFDASLLRPLAGSGTNAWPNLQQLDIQFHQTAPSGVWYFTGQPPTQSIAWRSHRPIYEGGFDFDREYESTGMQPECTFRLTPDDEALSPLIEAFADAVGQMPKVRNAILHSTLTTADEIEQWFVIAYIGPCFRPSKCQGQCHRLKERKLVTDLLGWSPDDGLMAKLCSMGSDYHEGQMMQESMDNFLKRHS